MTTTTSSSESIPVNQYNKLSHIREQHVETFNKSCGYRKFIKSLIRDYNCTYTRSSRDDKCSESLLFMQSMLPHTFAYIHVAQDIHSSYKSACKKR